MTYVRGCFCEKNFNYLSLRESLPTFFTKTTANRSRVKNIFFRNHAVDSLTSFDAQFVYKKEKRSLADASRMLSPVA